MTLITYIWSVKFIQPHRLDGGCWASLQAYWDWLPVCSTHSARCNPCSARLRARICGRWSWLRECAVCGAWVGPGFAGSTGGWSGVPQTSCAWKSKGISSTTGSLWAHLLTFRFLQSLFPIFKTFFSLSLHVPHHQQQKLTPCAEEEWNWLSCKHRKMHIISELKDRGRWFVLQIV